MTLGDCSGGGGKGGGEGSDSWGMGEGGSGECGDGGEGIGDCDLLKVKLIVKLIIIRKISSFFLT